MLRKNQWLGLAFSSLVQFAIPVEAAPVVMGPFSISVDGVCTSPVVFLEAVSATNFNGWIHGQEEGNQGDCAAVNGLPVMGSYNASTDIFTLTRAMPDPTQGFLWVSYNRKTMKATAYQFNGTGHKTIASGKSWRLK